MNRPLARLRLVLSLVRRDYAVQFAGAGLGMLWAVVQYLFQIAVFFLIFGVVFPRAAGARAGLFGGPGELDYLSYLLGGMCLFLPVQEMLLRGCSILADNRILVRRTNLGMTGFLWVPVAEAILHYALVFGLVAAAGLLRGNISPLAPLAFLFGVGVIFFLAGWAFVLARVSVLLKDVTPLMRLGLQLAFWATPIVYMIDLATTRWFAWNPAAAPLALHRALLFVPPDASSVGVPVALLGDGGLWIGCAVFAILSLVVYGISRLRLGALVEDHV